MYRKSNFYFFVIRIWKKINVGYFSKIEEIFLNALAAQ
jgi:hypothetical protein